MKKYIIKEIPAEQADFSTYFDNDGLTEAGGDYCYNLFIVAQSRDREGFNEKEYQSVLSEIEEIVEYYDDILSESEYANYSSVEELLKDYGLEMTSLNFFDWCREKPSSPYGNYFNNLEAFPEEGVAKYLTIKTGKEWSTDSANGYCQGDYVKMVYCKEYYTEGVKHYGEIWLGAGKEFTITFLNGNGEEEDTIGGYIVADCQAWKDEDYKKLVCEWEGIDEAETELQMVDGQHITTTYSYRTI